MTAGSAQRCAVTAGLVAWGLPRWLARHWRYSLLLTVLVLAGHLVGSVRTQVVGVALALLPAVIATVWARFWPFSFERRVAGPWRRRGWRRWAGRSWPSLARECGLSVQRKTTRREVAVRSGRPGRVVSTATDVPIWVHPKLLKVTTTGDTLILSIRTRVGQTVDDLERAAGPLGAASGAVSWRCRPVSTSVLEVALVMREAVATMTVAAAPKLVDVDAVSMGRRQDGTAWRLPLRGRHTLVVGCSGSGKGSVLWGVCGGLAPAVSADVVRLWGVDLKRGVEISMGRELFFILAVTPVQALSVLRQLLAVIADRGRSMAGVTRLHAPRAGDPLHVLVIDELAALTAYADAETKREASRLLSEILTQGRALGVVVLACVQDPRKETVGMRGLFTQTVALRLRSADETRMTLGDGMAAVAPAHRLSPDAPGSAWVVEDDGHCDRVRADYWPDDLVRATARLHPAQRIGPVAPLLDQAVGSGTVGRPQDGSTVPPETLPVAGSRASGRKRSARAPRSNEPLSSDETEGIAS